MIIKNEIDVTPYLGYSEKAVPIIEAHYSASYLCETEFYIGDKWTGDLVGLLFYQPTPNIEAGHSNYFIIYYSPIYNATMIVDGLDTVNNMRLNCYHNGEHFVYSRCNHDFRNAGAVHIDGGRLYTRYVGNGVNNKSNFASFKIEKDQFVSI